MRKNPTSKRPYLTMESAMTAILRDASRKMHHGILFDRRLVIDCAYKCNCLYFSKFISNRISNIHADSRE